MKRKNSVVQSEMRFTIIYIVTDHASHVYMHRHVTGYVHSLCADKQLSTSENEYIHKMYSLLYVVWHY